jgi:hypothetical protein
VTVSRVVAFAAAVMWVTGNIVVVVTAPTLFAHAPPKAPANGVSQDLVSHEGAGAVFGDILHAWSRVLECGPLPACAIATALLSVALYRRGWRATASLCSAALVTAIACHGWGWWLQARMSDLLASLRAGTSEGSAWSSFNALHHRAEAVMGAETVAALVLAALIGTVIARAPAGLPTKPQPATI